MVFGGATQQINATDNPSNEVVFDVIARSSVHPIEFTITALTFVIGCVTLWLVYRQLSEVLKSNTTMLEQLKQAILANQRIGEGERLLATHQLIVKLETDGDHLDARQFFGKVRDGKVEGKTLKGIVDSYFSSVDGATSSEEHHVTDEYRKVISYLNVMELTAVGIISGCYDEQALRRWHRRAIVRNISKAKDAIEHLRKKSNPKVFAEAEKLACYWADGETEQAELGNNCAALAEKFSDELSRLSQAGGDR